MNILKLGTSTLKLNNLVLTINPATSTLLNGLLAYWKFEEASGTFADSSGNNHTLTGTSTAYQQSGKINYSISQDADTDYVYGGSVSAFRITTFSISLWVKSSTTGVQMEMMGVAHNAFPPATGWRFNVSTDGFIYFYYANNDVEDYNMDTTHNILDNRWHHIVVTYSPTSTSIYVDNSIDPDYSPHTPSLTMNYNANAPLHIGNSYYHDAGWIGNIDEVAIWNRVLTKTEISALFNYNKGLAYPFTYAAPSGLLSGLMGYWNLDENSGTLMADLLGANALTLNGIAAVNATGKLGKAVNFNDNSGYSGALTLPNNFSLNKFTGNSITISMWVKLNATPTADVWLFDLHNAGGSDRIYSTYNLADNQLYFACLPASPAWDEYSRTDPFTLSTTVWTHLVFTCGGLGTNILIYVNGVQSATTIWTLATAIDAVQGSNDTFGNAYDGYNGAIYGMMDEIGIWNRALTPTEIATLYNSGNGLSCPF